MFARTIKKALLFFVVDIFIIIGIFVLQLINDSIITEKNGNLQITLSETKDNNNNSVLRNNLTLVFNGVTLSCDDSKPAQIIRNDSKNEKIAVALKSWKKIGETEYEFGFTENVKLKVSVKDTSEKGSIMFSADVPSDVSSFYMPNTIASNTEISDRTASRILMGSKKALWEFTASSLDGNQVRFTGLKPSAAFSYFEQTVEFKFASLSGSDLVESYNSVIRNFRDNIISAYKGGSGDILLNENSVVAYVAEQGSRGNYMSAIEEIPQSFRRSDTRTYLSAPFFNNLAEMNKTLEASIKEKDSIIRKAGNNDSLSLFTIRNIADYMYLYPNSSIVKRITENAGSANVEHCSLAEAAGILRTYVEMMNLSKAYASHMEGSLNACVEKIEKACKMEGGSLTMSENGTFLSVVQAVEVGDALLRYGQFIGDQSIIAGGKAIISSYIGESTSFDIRTLSDLYPVIVHDNYYYPHFVKIYTNGDNVVWAWTSARKIDYERGEDQSISFNIDFPSGDTHYVMLRGISPFRSIYIYNIAFRTDPRFESYNSSGYVYDYETKALLLKSRHKEETETIRLVYAAKAQNESEASESGEKDSFKAEEKTSENQAVTETVQESVRMSDEDLQRMQQEATRRAQAAAQAQAQAAAQAAAQNRGQ